VIADKVQAVALQAQGAVQAGRADRGVRLVKHSDNFKLYWFLVDGPKGNYDYAWL